MQLAQRSQVRGLAASGRRAAPARPARRAAVVTRAGLDTNLFFNIFASGAAGAAAVAVTLITAEDTDKEIERIKTVEGALVRASQGAGRVRCFDVGRGARPARTPTPRAAARAGPPPNPRPAPARSSRRRQPVAAAIGADAIAHSIPGLNVLLALLSEPAGAAAGVAYMMSLVLSSPAVDPATLAPKGTILNAEKAADSRGRVRVPFTQIVPTGARRARGGAGGQGAPRCRAAPAKRSPLKRSPHGPLTARPPPLPHPQPLRSSISRTRAAAARAGRSARTACPSCRSPACSPSSASAPSSSRPRRTRRCFPSSCRACCRSRAGSRARGTCWTSAL
jgi:hypothetical protein